MTERPSDAAAPIRSIAFLGIGRMGALMAGRLLAAGFALTVWNRTPAKADELVAAGARRAASPAAAARGADLIITMLSTGEVVGQILFEQGVLETLRPSSGTPSSLIIDTSSISPHLAKDHARRCAADGIELLDAPVSGGTRGAADGSLAIMVGGSPAAFERARPVLEHLGHPTYIGPPGAGQWTKLANQLIVAVTIGAVSEGLLLATAGGADPARVHEVLQRGFADSRILREHGARMLGRDWRPGGTMRVQLKDLVTISQVADAAGLYLPLAQTVERLYGSAVAAGLGGHDHSALLLELERANPGFRVGTAADQSPKI